MSGFSPLLNPSKIRDLSALLHILAKSSKRFPMQNPTLLSSLALSVLLVAAACGTRPTPPAVETPETTPIIPQPNVDQTERSFELIQSIPVDTQLDHPSLRYAEEAWVQMIEEAKLKIDIGQFYISERPKNSSAPGSLDPVMEALKKAGERGVKIRLMISNALHDRESGIQESFKKIKTFKNVDARIYNIKSLNGGIIHSKYWVIDGKKAFLGSQNFDWRALHHIHELGVLFTETQAVQTLQDLFDADWEYIEDGNYSNFTASVTRAPRPVHQLEDWIEVVAAPGPFQLTGVSSSIDALENLLRSAKKRVRIQLLSYKYWRRIDDLLRETAKRGVQVDLLVSHWNIKEPHLGHLQSLSSENNIDVRYSRIPTHSTGRIPFARVIHSKYVVVDEARLWLGTSNWSKSYFTTDRAIEMIIPSAEAARTGNEIFEKLWSSQYTKSIFDAKIEDSE